MSYLNNSKINYINNLKLKFAKKMKKLRKEHKNLDILPILAGIEIIERENRFFMWRFFEYLFFTINYALYRLVKKPLINYSIGKYQLKVEYILEYKKIGFRKESKNLFLLENLSLRDFLEIIACSNAIVCLESILQLKFINFNWSRLTEDNIKKLALFYSRNIEFIDDFNYFTILKELYFYQKLDY